MSSSRQFVAAPLRPWCITDPAAPCCLTHTRSGDRWVRRGFRGARGGPLPGKETRLSPVHACPPPSSFSAAVFPLCSSLAKESTSTGCPITHVPSHSPVRSPLSLSAPVSMPAVRHPDGLGDLHAPLEQRVAGRAHLGNLLVLPTGERMRQIYEYEEKNTEREIRASARPCVVIRGHVVGGFGSHGCRSVAP